MDRRTSFFLDREDAGERLARALHEAALCHPLVLGVPRGGMAVAAAVARALGGELDLVLVRKLRAPGAPELALGAVAADGTTAWNPGVLRALGLSPSDVAAERDRRAREALLRSRALRGGLPPISATGRDVLVIDDGVATGATLRAALRATAHQRPARLVAAVPVGSPHACAGLRLEFPEFVCLHEPVEFSAVGDHYLRFQPIDDDEVTRILSIHAARPSLEN